MSVIEAPISMRDDKRVKRFINKTLIPQIMFWGMKDGESEDEIDQYIKKEIGDTLQKQIATVRSGKFDEWNIEDLI
jgi:hypothetical protein